MTINSCKLDYPKMDMSNQMKVRGARAIDAEDAQYAAAGIGYVMCQLGEAFKKFLATPGIHVGLFGSYEKIMP